jgi:hypothetical protein
MVLFRPYLSAVQPEAYQSTTFTFSYTSARTCLQRSKKCTSRKERDDSSDDWIAGAVEVVVEFGVGSRNHGPNDTRVVSEEERSKSAIQELASSY